MLEDVTVEDEAPDLLLGVKTHNEKDPARRNRNCVMPDRLGLRSVRFRFVIELEVRPATWIGRALTCVGTVRRLYIVIFKLLVRRKAKLHLVNVKIVQ